MIQCPKLCRRTFCGVVLGLAIFALPAVSRALDIIAPIQLPVFALRIPSVPLKEKIIRIPMTVSRPGGVQRLTLEATLYRPQGPGPFPLLVLSHGTSRNPRERVGERLRYDAQSWKFVSMGFAVVIPMRRGYGHSEGDYAEGEGLCDHAHFYEAGLESARDLRATVEYVSALPGIDPERLVLAGHSSGGFASLILASQGLPGVRGVINFAGGRGSSERQNCSPHKLVEACGLAGHTTRVPTLWVYAQNDSFFPPPVGPADVRRLPPGRRPGRIRHASALCRRRTFSFHGRAGLGLVDTGGQPVPQRSRVPGVDAATLGDTELRSKIYQRNAGAHRCVRPQGGTQRAFVINSFPLPVLKSP